MARQRNGGQKKEPAQRFTAWTGSSRVEVAVWQNEHGYSVSTQRSYKNDDEWKTSQSLFTQDILPMSNLLEQAWVWISEQE